MHSQIKKSLMLGTHHTHHKFVLLFVEDIFIQWVNNIQIKFKLKDNKWFFFFKISSVIL